MAADKSKDYPYEYANWPVARFGYPGYLTQEEVFTIEATALGHSGTTHLGLYFRYLGFESEVACHALKAKAVFDIYLPTPTGILPSMFDEYEQGLSVNDRLKLSLALFFGCAAHELVSDHRGWLYFLKKIKTGEWESEKNFSLEEIEKQIYEATLAELRYTHWDRDLELIGEVFDAGVKIFHKDLPESVSKKELTMLSGIRDFEDPRSDLQFVELGFPARTRLEQLVLRLEGFEAELQIQELESIYEYFLFKKELAWEQRRLAEWTAHSDLIVRVKEGLSKRLLTFFADEVVKVWTGSLREHLIDVALISQNWER